ncbi:MAG: phosphoribosylamine--glycine ligase [Bacteroides sp. SM23_62]|nr:MAG: phosphoribosylamine--glycine ligase [Bacteroides sp. SM23_62]
MKVLILGSGGREHALAWKISQSPLLTSLFVAPGNAGTAQLGTNVELSVTDFPAIKSFVLEHDIEMVVVGPEAPLVAGIYDYFIADRELKKIPLIGPSKLGASLEGSKKFANEFMVRHNIPTARYKNITLDTYQEGVEYLKTMEPPYVLKADGLAAGKGVLLLDSLKEAEQELKVMLEGKFGDASANVVIEEFLPGIELSVFVLTDGISYLIFPEAKDYKRIGEGDTGLNTGGMGAISPVPFADKIFLRKVEEKIVKPTVAGLNKENIDYKGFLYVGLMNVLGNPYVVEYNVRMGDPEGEAVLPRIKSDLLDLFMAVSRKKLRKKSLEIDARTVSTVMLVSKGYPGAYEKGKEINGLEDPGKSVIFHAGTKLTDGRVVTNGGRVLSVTAFGEDMTEALARTYKTAERIQFEGKNYRRDIGYDL